ncbi:hypothetical protein BX600DRAFT_439721 [Xylariales sp. PMI_506]|nr:hypothetical protein BX600DRAFT_439721 [Xylariales sp. PMI_506]
MAPILQVLSTRQSDGTSSGTNLSGGAIAGIVIGCIVGVLLLLWIIRSCSNMGNPNLWGGTYGAPPGEKYPPAPAADYVRHSHNGSAHHHHHRHHDGHHHSRRSHSRSSSGRGYSRSPHRRASVEVTSTTTRPVYVERGRSPRTPQPVYYAREARRDRRGSRTYYG